MVTYTPNKNLAEPARGEYLGTWDTPVNSNTSILDNSLGGYTTVPLSNANVVLSPAQYQNTFITFTSTVVGGLAANIVVTLPAVGSFYTFQNLTNNTSAFVVTLTTTASTGQYISLPPGEPIDVFTDGTNVKFRNLGRVGSYWDYAGSSIPNWVSGCSIPPYLNCDGSAFSSAAYPVLATVLGRTILPDYRGTYRTYLNQGTGRLTSSALGLDGDTIFARGGSAILSSANIPPVPINDPGHTHTTAVGLYGFGAAGHGWYGPNNNMGDFAPGSNLLNNSYTGITAGSTSPTTFQTAPPSQIGGICMIRAA